MSLKEKLKAIENTKPQTIIKGVVFFGLFFIAAGD